MGRKKNRNLKKLRQDSVFDQYLDTQACTSNIHLNVKQLSKKKRKELKKQVTTTTKYRWHLVKVYDTVSPTKTFLEESFKSFVDNDFKMLGFHHSSESSRFYLENDTDAATSISALNKRMQGSQGGKLMIIQMEPCDTFPLLNANQIAVVKQALQRRYDASARILDLTNFHHDPLLLEQDILAVLSDVTLCKQILTLVRDNIPNLNGLNLSKNSLKLTSVRVVVATLNKCPITAINMEFNDLDNVREVVGMLAAFPLTELRLEGNAILKTIKNPQVYIKMVLSKLTGLKMLDNVDIENYLAEKAARVSRPTTESSQPAILNSTITTSITETSIKTFLDQYYTFIDATEQRLQLVQAYTPEATLEIQSRVGVIPSGIATGHDAIRAALTALPATKHGAETFALNFIKVEPTVGQLEVCGQLQVEGYGEIVSFVHSLNIVPYNSGLGCSMGLLVFK